MKGSLGNLLVILYLIIGSSGSTKSYSLSVTQDLGVSVLEDVDNRNDSRALGQTLLLSCGNKRPELVDVDGGAPEEVAGEVEVTHTNLTEVTRVVLIKVGSLSHRRNGRYVRIKVFSLAKVKEIDAPVVVLTTSETTTSGVFTVLSDTSMTGRDVAAVLASLGEP